MATRTKIPETARNEVLYEAGYMCSNPRCRHILTLELHHIVWVKDGGGNEVTNLLCLCPNCHSLHTHGHIPATAIVHWKGMLQALNVAFTRESRDLLLYLHKMGDRYVWYGGDGLLRFASLISAGLVEITELQHGDGITGSGGFFGSSHKIPPATAGLVELSERGRALVEAWLGREIPPVSDAHHP